MDEREWLECDDPEKMLKQARFRSHRRKSRLFCAACCRCLWDSLVDGRSRVAVEAAERHADGAATDEELRVASEAAHAAHREMFDTLGKVGSTLEWAAAYAADPSPLHGARSVAWMARWSRFLEVRLPRPNDRDEIRHLPCTVSERAGQASAGGARWQITLVDEAVPTGADGQTQAMLIRCLFGNPFRPVPPLAPSLLAWIHGTVRRLAEDAYQGRELPSGHLDRTLLGVVADALDEAGADAELLDHLRGPSPHWRGCHVLDLILAKG